MTRPLPAALAALLLSLLLALPAARAESPLSVRIEGVRNAKGVVHVLLFDKARPFDKQLYGKLFRYAKVPAAAGTLTAAVKNVPAGTYAAMIHHDENDNGQFEMKGPVPLEGYAYSNNVGTEAVPSFKQAAFAHADAAVPLTVTMIYFE